MGDSFKKIWKALIDAISDISKTRSIKSVQQGVGNVIKSVDVESLKKDLGKFDSGSLTKGAKGLVDKAQKVSGVDLKKIASKTGVDVNALSQKAHELASKAGEGAVKAQGSPGRPMKFPYTFSAKVAHFPWKFYVKNNWIWRYYVYAFVVCIPMFSYFTGMANTPGNVKKWKELQKAEHAEHHH